MYKILIVDDEPWIIKGLSASCQWEDYDCEVVYTTTNPKEALKYILENEPDIVFTDIKMDEMTGIDLIRRTRQALNQNLSLLVDSANLIMLKTV